jgi:hypothetical protein
MTLAQLLTDLNARIGSTPEVSNANMTLWINEALRAFCNEYDFHWLYRRKTANTIANQREYNLPTDCKTVVEIQVDPTDDDPNIYEYKVYQQRFGVDPTQETISIMNNIMRLNPAPTTNGANNIHLTYIRYPTNLVEQSDSPSDTGIAGMPEVYHPALVMYAYAMYNSYDEEQAEFGDIMGNPIQPKPGTYSYFVKMARDESEKIKRGSGARLISLQEAIGYTLPNDTGGVSVVLGV